MLKYQNIAVVGQKIRAYDYDPAVQNDPKMYVEGEVLRILKTPYSAYEIMCETCSISKRVGEKVTVPMEVSSFEFEGRVSLLNK